jgi:hypothetical protein
MSCSPLKVNRRFGGTCRLHLQGRRISRARNQCKSRWQAELSERSVDFQRTTRRWFSWLLCNVTCDISFRSAPVGEHRTPYSHRYFHCEIYILSHILAQSTTREPLFSSEMRQHVRRTQVFCCTSQSGQEPKQSSIQRRHGSAEEIGRNAAAFFGIVIAKP